MRNAFLLVLAFSSLLAAGSTQAARPAKSTQQPQPAQAKDTTPPSYDMKPQSLQDLEGMNQKFVTLAQAIPADKFTWRPAPGVRSVSEVYMHIVEANFYLLSVAGGPKFPADYKEGMDTSVKSKPEVIAWLKRSLDVVKQAHAKVTPADLQRKVHIADRNATVDGMYLRIIVHANEHMGQLVAYARMTGVTPPWSQ